MKKIMTLLMIVAATSAALADSELGAFDLEATEYVPAISLMTGYPGPVVLPMPAYEVLPCEADNCYFVPDVALEVVYWQVAQSMNKEFRLLGEALGEAQIWMPVSSALSGSVSLQFQAFGNGVLLQLNRLGGG